MYYCRAGYWFGAWSSEGSTSPWVWVDGSKVNWMIPWGTNKPFQGIACAYLMNDQGVWKWFDNTCDGKTRAPQAFICDDISNKSKYRKLMNWHKTMYM